MSNTIEQSIDSRRRGQSPLSLYSLKLEAQLEELDRQGGCEYLPMDVFVSPLIIKEHFQDSSIYDRRIENFPRVD